MSVRIAWQRANLADRLLVVYFTGLAIAIVLTRQRVPDWPAFLWLHVVVIALIATLVLLQRRFPDAHAWYPWLLPVIAFHEAAALHQLSGQGWQDRHLLAFEAWLLPVPPTVWLGRAVPAVAGEVLQAGYLSYFVFLPLVAGVLYARQQMAAFTGVMSGTVLAYVACYVIFIAWPTEGPAHTLRHLHTEPLPGGPLHDVVAFVQQAGTHGNAFPSAHAAGAVVPLMFARRYVPRLFPWLLPLLVLLCLGAVYDRYHYVSDMAGGVIIGLLAAWLVLPRDSAGCGTVAP